jgi:hypothetical protein
VPLLFWRLPAHPFEKAAKDERHAGGAAMGKALLTFR